jgi:hypothetical protein
MQLNAIRTQRDRCTIKLIALCATESSLDALFFALIAVCAIEFSEIDEIPAFC